MAAINARTSRRNSCSMLDTRSACVEAANVVRNLLENALLHGVP